MNGFGLSHIKKEGAAMHPDEIISDLTDDQYKLQALKYIVDTDDKQTCFARDDLMNGGAK